MELHLEFAHDSTLTLLKLEDELTISLVDGKSTLTFSISSNSDLKKLRQALLKGGPELVNGLSISSTREEDTYMIYICSLDCICKDYELNQIVDFLSSFKFKPGA